jgi:hypothetical protein
MQIGDHLLSRAVFYSAPRSATLSSARCVLTRALSRTCRAGSIKHPYLSICCAICTLQGLVAARVGFCSYSIQRSCKSERGPTAGGWRDISARVSARVPTAACRLGPGCGVPGVNQQVELIAG